GSYQEVIGFQNLSQAQEFFGPLLASGLVKSHRSTFDCLNYEVVLSLNVPFKKNVVNAETVHALQFEIWAIAGMREGVDHFGFAAAAFAFCEQWHSRDQRLTQILEGAKLKNVTGFARDKICQCVSTLLAH